MEIKRSTLIVALAAIAAISFAVVAPLTGWVTRPPAVTEYFVEGAMMIIIIGGAALMLWIVGKLGKANNCCARPPEDYQQFDSQPSRDEDSSPGWKFKYIERFWEMYKKATSLTDDSTGVIIFAKGALILIIWKAVDAGQCIDPLNSYKLSASDSDQKQTLHNTILRDQFLISLTAFQVLFIIAQMGLLVYANSKNFILPKRCSIPLKIVLVVNMIIYAYTFLLETEEELQLKSEGEELLKNETNLPDKLVECLNHTMRMEGMTEHIYVDSISPYLYPLSIEFYLACSVLILGLLSQSDKIQVQESYITAGEVAQVIVLIIFRELLSVIKYIIMLPPSILDLLTNYGRALKSPTLFLRRIAILAFSVLSTISVFIEVYIVICVTYHVPLYYTYVLLHYIIKMCNSFIMFGSALTIAFHIHTMLQKQKDQAMKSLIPEDESYVKSTPETEEKKISLGASDLLLLVATAGLVVYHLFPLCGIMTIADPVRRSEALSMNVHDNHTIFNDDSVVELGSLSICTSVLLGLEVLIQTAVIILGHKLDSKLTVNNPAMFYLCKYVAYNNFQIWLNSSLALSSVSETDPMAEVVFSRITWIIISRCIIPMVLFYRLHSVHLLKEVGSHLFGGRCDSENNNSDDRNRHVHPSISLVNVDDTN